MLEAHRKAEAKALQDMVNAQAIESAFMFTDHLLCVTVRSRQCALEILTRNKFTGRKLFFTEQLTKRRQGTMSDLKKIRDENPSKKISVFSRNGVPSIRVGDDRFVPIKTPGDLRRIEESIHRERQEHRQTPLRPTPEPRQRHK